MSESEKENIADGIERVDIETEGPEKVKFLKKNGGMRCYDSSGNMYKMRSSKPEKNRSYYRCFK